MSVEPILLKEIVENTNFSDVNRSEFKQEQFQPDGLEISDSDIDMALTISPIIIIFSWIFFLLTVQKVRNYIDNKVIFTIKNPYDLPCKNCCFYSSNHYLKCAVKPSIVLTEEAKDCCEYLPKYDKISPKKILK
ncbi:hypothetical protein VB620_08510 [Nodularia harveyana UHCC-0300]|uniref:Uncharacterized protein n=1 Tax=Nodularia harveyana UHCC-0300 TaxID=2974287 RepID=A0ABU5UCX7_9CYAN|nr:hypothetical protein [Nodularia harveyana]MEA5581378.1 hypothetical protein [Nodularia harveyana UHCC-0300]